MIPRSDAGLNSRLESKTGMATERDVRLRVLVSDERGDRLQAIAVLVEALGHEVITRNVALERVGEYTRTEQPDVAIVGIGLSEEEALDTISTIVHEATCPVIAALDAEDPAYITEAAKRGVFAYVVVGDNPDELHSALDITLRRFAEFHNLEGAFGRRAVIEQAKGILMERHGIDAQTAFEQLRSHSQRTGHKLVDVAQALIDSHLLVHPPEQPQRE
jgi:response regulator NasT